MPSSSMKEGTKWWVGTFPSWIVSGLLAGILWFMMRTLDQVERRLTAFEATVPRIATLETKTEVIASSIIELKDDMKEIKRDIKVFGK